MFSVLKVSRKSNNNNIRLCEQTSNVQCMYLALKNFKMRSKKVSNGDKANNKVGMTFFQVKTHRIGAADRITN